MWVSDDTKSGGKRVDFVQKVKNTGKVCLGGGVAIIKKAGAAKSKL
jgi:peroxisomal enoyl-CoA hydratase 2